MTMEEATWGPFGLTTARLSRGMTTKSMSASGNAPSRTKASACTGGRSVKWGLRKMSVPSVTGRYAKR